MKGWIRRRVLRLALVTTTLLGLAGGIAYATIPLPSASAALKGVEMRAATIVPLTLELSPTLLAKPTPVRRGKKKAKPNPLAGWRFGGTFTNRSPCCIGQFLETSRRSGRVLERHVVAGYDERGPDPISFDGKSGRLALGTGFAAQGAVADASVTAVGQPTSVPAPGAFGNPNGCSGSDLVAQPVLLSGNVRLVTKTRLFGTVRRTRLHGVLLYGRGGDPACTGPPSSCLKKFLSASQGQSGFHVSIRSVPEVEAYWSPTGFSGTAYWYHDVRINLSQDPITGTFPSATVTLPKGQAIAGSGAFVPGTQRSFSAPCGTYAANTGSFTGVLTTTFTGFGRRTLAFTASIAGYEVQQ